MGGLLVTSMAWVASLACLAVVAWRLGVAASSGRWAVLRAGTGLVVVGGVNAVLASLMLGPWTGADGSLTHGEAWFLMAGALNLGAVVVGAALLRSGPLQPPPKVGGGTPSVVRLLDDVPANDRQLLRHEDDLLQRTVAAKMAIELDEPQLALDALEPVIRFLSSSVTCSLRSEMSPRPSALP